MVADILFFLNLTDIKIGYLDLMSMPINTIYRLLQRARVEQQNRKKAMSN